MGLGVTKGTGFQEDFLGKPHPSRLWSTGRIQRRDGLTCGVGPEPVPTWTPAVTLRMAANSSGKQEAWLGGRGTPAAQTGFDPVILYPSEKCTGK